MKKKLGFFGILILILTLALAGCAGGGDDNDKKSSRKEKRSREEEEEDEEDDEEEKEKEEEDEKDEEGSGEDGDPADALRADELLTVYVEDHKINVYTDDRDTLTYGDAYVITIDDDAERAPALAKWLDRRNEDVTADFEDFIRGVGIDAQELWGNGFCVPCYHSEYLQLLRADGSAFSFCITNDDYFGGAHNVTGFLCSNIDTKTGEAIPFSAVVKDTSHLADIIYDELLKQNEDIEDFLTDEDKKDFMEMLETSFEDDADQLNWGLTNEGILVCLGDYSLGTYAAGAHQVSVRFADHPEIFTDTYAFDNTVSAEKQVKEKPDVSNEYRAAEFLPQGSVTPIEFSDDGKATAKLEMKKDGQAEKVSFTAGTDVNGYFDSLTMEYAGNKYTFGEEIIYGFGMKGFWVVTPRNEKYLYLQQYEDNDNISLGVFSFEDDQLTFVGWGEGAVEFSDWSADNGAKPVTMTSPSHFLVHCMEQRLGTMFYNMECRVGYDGMPEEIGDARYYSGYDAVEYRTLQDIPAQIINERGNGETIDPGTLPKGSVVHPYRCGDSWIDVTVDGVIYRLSLEPPGEDEWACTIDGKPVTDLFDGLIFAG